MHMYFVRAGFIALLLACVVSFTHAASPQETLFIAAERGDAGGVRAALQAGAKVNGKDADGWTALFYAATSGNLEVVNALLTAGADVNASSKVGDTVLMVAANKGDAAVVKALLDKGAKPKTKNKGGHDASYFANKNNHTTVVALLRGEKVSMIPAAPIGEPAKILLPTGLTLFDWINAAQSRVEKEPEAVLQEASQYLRLYGPHKGILTTTDNALARLLSGMTFRLPSQARAALPGLQKLLVDVGEWPALLLAVGKAKHLSGDFAGAKQMYGQWLIKMPVTDAGRDEVLKLITMVNDKQLLPLPRFVAAAKLGDKDKWGIIDEHGTWVIQPQYDEVGFYTDNDELIPARMGNLWGLIDTQGTWLVKPGFEQLRLTPRIGWYIAKNKDKYGCIDRQGKWVIQPTFDELQWLSKKKQWLEAKVGEKWGIIDGRGAWIMQPAYDEIRGMDDKTAFIVARQNNKWGMLDSQGAWKISPSFDDMSGFSEGLAGVRTGDISGYIDEYGKWIIEIARDGSVSGAYRFKSDLALVCLKDTSYIGDTPSESSRCGLINKNGQWVVHPAYSYLDHYHFEEQPLMAAWLFTRDFFDIKSGYINRKGETVIPFKFTFTSNFNKTGIAQVNIRDQDSGARAGFINSKGEWLIRPRFSEAREFVPLVVH